MAEMLRKMREVAPFSSYGEARGHLERVMREVEDMYSGIPEDPNAQFAKISDGRMYPPHDRFAFSSGVKFIKAFRQKEHKTFFGDNGAIRIERISDGLVELDSPGTDNKTIENLRMEIEHESD